MDNIQFEIKEKTKNDIVVTEQNKKVSFSNTVQVKTIPNNDQLRQQKQMYNETQILQNIYGKDLDKERENQKKILQDIERQNQWNHLVNLEATLRGMRR